MERLPGRVHDVLGRRAVLGEQVRGIAGAFGEGVGQADAAQGTAQAGLGQGFATAEPRPPMTEWFSAVTTTPADLATDRTVAVSNGLMTGILTATVTAPAARRTRAAASAGAIIMPLTSNATSQDAIEVHASPRIPAPPRLTPPPVLTPPPSVSARPAVCAPPPVTAPPALCPPPSVTAAPAICAPPRVTPPPEVCAPPEVTPPPSVPAPPVVGAPPPVSSPRHSSTWARPSDNR
jgi:hypothetical protein